MNIEKELRFLYRSIHDHPQILKISSQIGWRNITSLLDYNFLGGRSFKPKGVSFRISGQCNLSCQMCIYHNAGFLNSKLMLPLPIFKKVIDEVYTFGLFVVITGGEPLLHPNIIECIKYVKAKGLHCSLVTNGWLLAQRAEDILESGLDLLSVSIDGPEEVHDRIRGQKGSYQKAFEGIQKVTKIKGHPLFFINTSIQSQNYGSLDKLVDRALGVGVDGMNVQILWTRPPDRAALHNKKFPEYPVREGWADESLLQIDFNVLEEVLKRIKRSSLFVNVFPAFNTQQIHTWYTTPAKLLKDHRAKCPWMMANVFHDGTMRMCDDVIIGDLKESSFWEIWNSERMTDFRRTLKNHKHFPICAGCCSMFRNNIL